MIKRNRAKKIEYMKRYDLLLNQVKKKIRKIKRFESKIALDYQSLKRYEEKRKEYMTLIKKLEEFIA